VAIELHSVYPRRRLAIRGKRIEFLKVRPGLKSNFVRRSVDLSGALMNHPSRRASTRNTSEGV